jgi:hypothetical protein
MVDPHLYPEGVQKTNLTELFFRWPSITAVPSIRYTAVFLPGNSSGGFQDQGAEKGKIIMAEQQLEKQKKLQIRDATTLSLTGNPESVREGGFYANKCC